MAEKHLSNRYKNPKGSCVGGLLYRIEYSLRLKNVVKFRKIFYEEHTELFRWRLLVIIFKDIF